MSPILALSLPYEIASVLVLVLGFGFVIFFHELGHFLAAKWTGIKVEQFAVGFGQALFSWRKGIGVRLGNTQKEYQQRLDDYIADHHKDDPVVADPSSPAHQDALREAETALGLGETEYRLNWIPLGGYVKMLGQDDLRPNAEQADPRSYNRKSIGARMVVVSAGVIMNVILAGILFTVLFSSLMGFKVPPAAVGSLLSNSPAQNTTTVDGKRKPLQVGDQILAFDGRKQEDFTKVGLWVALAPENTPLPITVQHLDKTTEELRITPRVDENTGFLSIGIGAPRMLQGLPDKDIEPLPKNWQQLFPADANAVQPGETITAINGKPVTPGDFWVLAQAAQDPSGKPVELTVKNESTSKTEMRSVQPHYDGAFSGEPLNFAGMVPRPAIGSVVPESSAVGKILPGDVVTAISFGQGGDALDHPTTDQLRDQLAKAGGDGRTVNLTVLRNGQTTTVDGLTPNLKVDRDKNRRGLGIGLRFDDLNAVVANVLPGSPAEAAHLAGGDQITAINGTPVSSWFDVQHLLASAKADEPVKVAYSNQSDKHETMLALNADQIFQVAGLRRSTDLVLRDYNITRQYSNPLAAAKAGITETRDFILQFYLTLRRMVGGSVSPKQLMGPVGIFVGGAKFAFRGWDWLVWFLAMISANLAVVNFLPIPIVDGGLFTFLILEKIQGKPLSPRAQAIAQYVGLAFLAGVFLFVTYHDIVRFIPFG
ncbi:MAG TPA: site-2 protease family protein [Tepidisphaeraceae bacterium]